MILDKVLGVHPVAAVAAAAAAAHLPKRDAKSGK